MMQEKFIQIAMNKTSTVYTTRSLNEQQIKAWLLHPKFLSGKFTLIWILQSQEIWACKEDLFWKFLKWTSCHIENKKSI